MRGKAVVGEDAADVRIRLRDALRMMQLGIGNYQIKRNREHQTASLSFVRCVRRYSAFSPDCTIFTSIIQSPSSS